MAMVTDCQLRSVAVSHGQSRSVMVSHGQSRQSTDTQKGKRLCHLTDKGFLEASHMVFARRKRKYTWQTTQIHKITEKNETLETPETPEKSVGYVSSHTVLH